MTASGVETMGTSIDTTKIKTGGKKPETALEKLKDTGLINTIAAAREREGNIILTTVDQIMNYARLSSLWPLVFGLACCAIEGLSMGMAHHDLARFGMEVGRASPRHADLMLVLGTVTKRMAPRVKKLYEMMPEPKEGPTVIWLRQTSKRLNLWMGTSFLEADGEDFYNTFVLTNPDGKDIIRVRKQTPAAMESYFFRGIQGKHSVDTELGKIGIGICYEGMRNYWSNLMHQDLPGLILMPLSAPTPMRSYYTSEKNIEDYNNLIKNNPQKTAQDFGIPVLMANKCGTWKTPMPWPLEDSTFPGFSQIIESDGTVKKQLDNKEGIIVADVVLDPSRKFKNPSKNYGRWSIKVPSYFNFMIISETIGKIWYSFNSERKRKALMISSGEIPGGETR